jgi:hypothetical protein
LVAAALASAAAADPGIAPGLGMRSLSTSDDSIIEQLTVSCSRLTPSLTLVNEFVNVSIKQASVRASPHSR